MSSLTWPSLPLAALFHFSHLHLVFSWYDSTLTEEHRAGVGGWVEVEYGIAFSPDRHPQMI